MRGVRRVFRLSFLRASDVDRDVDEEIAFHLALRAARLQADGLSKEAAAHLAQQRFGNVREIRDECRRESLSLARTERIMLWFDEVQRDIHFAMRSLVRAKGFA